MNALVRWWNRLMDKVIENDLNDHSLLTDVDCHISRMGGTLPENVGKRRYEHCADCGQPIWEDPLCKTCLDKRLSAITQANIPVSVTTDSGQGECRAIAGEEVTP